jgi:hypothetical protein
MYGKTIKSKNSVSRRRGRAEKGAMKKSKKVQMDTAKEAEKGRQKDED